MVKGLTGIHSASMTRLDSTHGSVLSAYAAMGKPINPTQAQIQQLRRAAMLTQPETMQVHQGQVTIVLPPQGLALIEFH
jgi:xylan 1,4-beta-xylosidase